MHSDVHSLEQWQVIGQQAAESIASQRRFLRFWKRSRSSTVRSLQEFVDLVYDTDIDAFNEKQFVTAEEILTFVISESEKYLRDHASHAELTPFAEAIRQLREARLWIKQGLSPDASKRPTEAERRIRAEQHAASVWADLLS